MNWEDLARREATAIGLDPELAARVLRAESAGRPDAVSPKGAVGLMQLMPGTAAELGVDPRDPTQNVRGGVRYLKQQLDAQRGDVNRALAAYNWGPGNLARQGMERAPAETRAYIARVTTAPQESRTVAGAPQMNPFDEIEARLRQQYGLQPPGDAPPARQTAPSAPPQPPAATTLPAQPPAAPTGLPAAPAAPSREAALLRQGLEMGPIGNALSNVGDRLLRLGVQGGTRLGAAVSDFAGMPETAARLRSIKPEDVVRAPTGMDRTSISGKVGAFGGDLMAANAGAGIVGSAVGGTGTALAARVPTAQKLGDAMRAAGDAIRSFGTAGGSLPTRMVGGGVAGYTAGQITDPENANTSAALGAAMPGVVAGGRVVGNVLGDTYNVLTGRAQPLAEKALGKIVGGPKEAAALAARMQANAPKFPISQPTGVQLANDPRISSLHRYALSRDPMGYAARNAETMAQQNAARVAAVERAGGTPGAVEAAKTARTAAEQFYRPGRDMDLGAMVPTSNVKRVLNQFAKDPASERDLAVREMSEALKRLHDRSSQLKPAVDAKTMLGVRGSIDDMLAGRTSPGNTMVKGGGAAVSETYLGRIRDAINATLHSPSRGLGGITKYDQEYARLTEAVKQNDTMRRVLEKALTSNTQEGVETMTAGSLKNALRSLDSSDLKSLGQSNRTLLANLQRELRLATEAANKAKFPGSPTDQLGNFHNNLPIGARALMGISGLPTPVSMMLNALTHNTGPRLSAAIGRTLENPQTLQQLLQRQAAPAGGYFAPGAEQLLLRGAPIAPAQLAQ